MTIFARQKVFGVSPCDIPPPTSLQVLAYAKSVDTITQQEFFELSQRVALPPPKTAVVSGTNMYLTYDAPVDGRILAAKFLGYLAGAGIEARIVRPKLLDIIDSTELDALRQRVSEVRKREYYVHERQSLLDLAALDNYSAGLVEIANCRDDTAYIIHGATPYTHSFSVSIPIASRERNDKPLFENFLTNTSIGFR
ncbi:hypothetical protein HYY70_00660 [Candidatus Woesearchaeota archaeon]|nr:hypothetical protein [Candidatus Woesearchaeota archaeon]